MNVRRTARGIGLRALVLFVGVVIGGAVLLWLALKIAGAAIQLVLWLGLILIVAAVVAVVYYRFRRRP